MTDHPSEPPTAARELIARTLHETFNTTLAVELAGGLRYPPTPWEDCNPGYRDAIRAAVDTITPLIAHTTEEAHQ
jgi:hypothetical protein